MHSIEEGAEYLSFIGAFDGITMFERLWEKCIQILYQFPMEKVNWIDSLISGDYFSLVA